MDVLTDDHEREEAVRKWWHEYWKPIALGVAIALLGLLGVRQYQSYMLGVHQEQAMEVYKLRQDLSRHGQSAVESANAFIRENEDIFGALLSLDVAMVEMAAGHYDKAAAAVEFARVNGGELIAPTATLAKARLQAQQGDTAAAVTTLQGLTDDAYAVEVSETLGDVYLAAGDKAKAREAYREAVKRATERELPVSPLLQMKADSVTVAGDEGVYKITLDKNPR